MSGRPSPSDDDDDDGRGCLFLIGAVIVGICVGNIYEDVYGWMVIGILFLFAALFGRSK
jgi:hypothetical protein